MTDYLGTRFHEHCLTNVNAAPSVDAMSGKPDFQDAYFEWIDLLEAVHGADQRFSMVELGAGYGRWSARAAMAARQHGIDDIRIIGAEAEPQHAIWLRETFELNKLQEPQATIIEAGVGRDFGQQYLLVRFPEGQEQPLPNEWYGQELLRPDTKAIQQVPNDLYLGHQIDILDGGWGAIRIPIVPLSSILQNEEDVDLIHMDIQGAELAVIESSVDTLNEKVKRLHIGTHSRRIDGGIIQVMSKAGWTCKRAYLCNSEMDTPYGPMPFEDGVQTWTNPKFFKQD